MSRRTEAMEMARMSAASAIVSKRRERWSRSGVTNSFCAVAAVLVLLACLALRAVAPADASEPCWLTDRTRPD